MIQSLLAVSTVCHSQQHNVMNTTDFFCDLHSHYYKKHEIDFVIQANIFKKFFLARDKCGFS
jgi:hypothetical protein